MTSRQQQFFSAIPTSWRAPLKSACTHPGIDALVEFLQKREANGAIIFPEKKNIFAALKETPFDAVRVVIVGQDPYHGPGQAHGLSFSVPPTVAQPPSLRNIFKELQKDINMPIPNTGTLTPWAQQGVLLLNALLTVEQHNPTSHANKGWELFTDSVIASLFNSKKPMVFMLWGSYAQKKITQLGLEIDPKLHLILKAAHPSPFSVSKFLGCRHFSQANAFLKTHNLPEIDWIIE